MSDLMFYGVLRMPYEMAMSDEMSRRQFYSRVQEAVRRVEAAEARLAEIDRATPSPSTAPTYQDQANVLPPTRGTGGQQEASGEVLTDKRITEVIARIGSHSLNVTRMHEIGGKTTTIMENEGVIEFARAIEAELAAGAAREGGNTSAKPVESGTAPIAEDEREDDSAPIDDYEKWLKGRGALGVGASPERVFIAGWLAGQNRASKPAAREAARQSIDTPEFRKLLGDLVRRASYNISGKASPAALIAYIDTWGGAAPAAGNSEQPKEE